MRIFMTGASGCIGHYLVETLIENTDHELFLMMRNPAKLQVPVDQRPGVHVLQGDMREVAQFSDLLKTMDTAILVATSWGDPKESYEINVEKTLEIMSLLDAERCRQVIYFSTASILDRDNTPLKEAGEIGTDYVRTKYICHEKMQELAIAPKVTTVFPTLVFGGSETKPYSHISGGLPEVAKYIGLIRFLSADGSLHYIHAKDIAKVVRHLVDNPPGPEDSREIVIGNPAKTADEIVEEIATYLGKPPIFRIPLSFGLADLVIKVFNIRMAEWDRFCMDYRHFTYENPVTPSSFGLEDSYPTVKDVFQSAGVTPKTS
ncbi:NAD(P)-dependent oxidoreductase [cf. Phormidesmis sp. LEGE 11477]|uniref:NAD-dependent epimerase/dehydratase family protein n=1 Tax=cf. Phormidesmis sp. LEGE 11477 TaxID=1828680 RepID=UPI001880BCD6|nr:NAD(P)-dependent oxidoreductase [cf. Phormidesmis sp. LEGE 11477]MBE9061001.1 NAD(P)-dependent oxidoreductase [cf. Phormidesmis sp. LEGE 11477]